MTNQDYKSFEKDKIQALQQTIDRLEREIQFLNNELLLCKETPKNAGITSRGNMSATPMIEFENDRIARILKGADKAMKKYSKKERDKNGSE
jgi:hypothetical protein